MRRILLLLVAGGLVAAAFMAPTPPEPEPPTFTGVAIADEGTSGSQGSVWYCPWINAGATRDSWLMLAAATSVNATVTLPSPIPNEPADGAEVAMFDASAEPVEVASVVRRGDAPGFVEFDDGPAAVASIVIADAPGGSTLVAGDRCVTSAPKLWHLPGGTTREGRTTTLRLFNPFPEASKVTVSGTSEFGDAGLVSLRSIDVAGRSWQDINLNELAPLLDELSLTVSADEGLVIPSLVVASGIDEATWPGTALSTTWEFPQVRQTGLQPALAITNPGEEDVEVSIDVFDPNGSVPDARTVTVPAGSPLRVPIGDLTEGFFGVGLRSTGPIAAVVIAEDITQQRNNRNNNQNDDESDEEQVGSADRIAGSPGAALASQRWLLPGPGAVPAATSSVWLLNSSQDPVTVSMQPLGIDDIPAEEVVIEAQSVLRLVLPQQNSTSGYLIEASEPITASWSVESGDGVAMVAGTALGG